MCRSDGTVLHSSPQEYIQYTTVHHPFSPTINQLVACINELLKPLTIEVYQKINSDARLLNTINNQQVCEHTTVTGQNHIPKQTKLQTVLQYTT